MNFSSTLNIAMLCLVVTLLAACSRPRQIVPYEVDTDEIYKILSPNEDNSPQEVTFGPDSIPGFTFDFEITTDKEDVYIFFENLTVLNINAKIGDAICDFVISELKEYGFLSPDNKFSGTEFSDLNAQGLSFSESAAKILDEIRNDFLSRANSLDDYNQAFNAYLQVYPVYLNNKIVTFRQSAYFYTGGAHGMTISYLKSYNLETGDELDLEDIIKPGAIEAVREEVAAHMAYSYPIYENITTVDQYIDSLNIWLDNFDPEDKTEQITYNNFPISDVAITEQGLVFIYQMYELTPGADGCPVIVISYKDLKGCINDNLGI